MKIVDGFIFYNELDILEIHLEEVYDVVDHIIIVEGTETFAGNPKPSYFLTNIARFEKYKDKIVHFITDFKEEFPFAGKTNSSSEKWVREDYQRECIKIACQKIQVNSDDIFILTDVDEIPNRNIIRQIRNHEIILDNKVYVLEMDLYYYSVEYTVQRKWTHVKVSNFAVLESFPLLKYFRHCWKTESIQNGGWHLSYFGDVNFIKNKMENYAEEHSPQQKSLAHISDCINKQVLPFNGEQLIKVEGLNLSLPKVLRTVRYTNYWFIHSEIKQIISIFVDSNKLNKFLEIGTHEGTASWFLSDNFLKHPNSKYVCVDPHSIDDKTSPLTQYTEVLFYNNISLSKNFSKISVFKMFSNDFFKINQETFTFIYIDGSHLLEDITSDFNNSLKVIEKGGIIWVDDYLGEDGIRIAKHIDQLYELNRDKLDIIFKNYQIAFRRKLS